MKRKDGNREAFFALLRAGLWEREVQLLSYGVTDFAEVLRMSKEQTVTGLVAAGIEHVSDMKPVKKQILPFIGRTIKLERRNQAMNRFIGETVEKMREAGIFSVLVKGQGVAQCYEKPLWRTCGDVDLLMDAENYLKARDFLLPLADSLDEEETERMHLGMTIKPWVVELHGTLHLRQMPRVNPVIDELQNEILYKGKTRVWDCEGTNVYLPAPDEDVVYVFAHVIQHYFGGGIGLRQICDWCRLLWTFRESLDYGLLESRIRKAGLMTEWKVFAALAVDWLDMPAGNMPFYSDSERWSWKARHVMAYILDTGNLGHNRSDAFRKKSFLVRSAVMLWRYSCDTVNHFAVFPMDSLKVWAKMVKSGVKSIF